MSLVTRALLWKHETPQIGQKIPDLGENTRNV